MSLQIHLCPKANKYEQILAKRADGISQNLHRALDRHNRLVNDDVTTALVEHVRSSIMYERQMLRELEALRPDVNSAADKVSKPNGIPRPTVIPPLEDATIPKPLPAPASGPSTPVTTQSTSPFISGVSSNVRQASVPPQSPGAGPSRSPAPSVSSFTPNIPPSPALNSPPLGGRFVDGTKSMFVKPTSSPLAASTPCIDSPSIAQKQQKQQQQAHDPLLSPHPVARSFSVPVVDSSSAVNGHANGDGGLDPLGQARPVAFMSASMRVQPSRPRLDAREAASKLANMF
jgi:hypothetical protein